MSDLIKLTIDGNEVEVAKGTSVLRACEIAGVQVPRFCYHSRLSIAGNCRMCLVEIEGSPKPVASCAFPVSEGQVVKTQSQIAKDARKAVMEFLLANHPLDCPLCDQGGECDLQDFSMGCGSDRSNFSLEKRTVNNPYLGPYIETFMNRCIHCMRCVRFSDEIDGKNELGGLFRGNDKIITNADQGEVKSNLSGNMIDLCPVGALTSKPAKYSARTWELAKNEIVDVQDSILPSIYADTFKNKIIRIRARENEEINQEWISDLTRFSYDGIYNNRIENVIVDSKTAEWKDGFDKILDILHKTDPKNIAAVIGDNQAVEDIYSFKDFMFNTLGVSKIYNKNVSSLKQFNKENFVFAESIANLELAENIIFIGTDLQTTSPVLNSRIFQQTRKRAVNVYNIGQNLEDYSYKINNLAQSLNILNENNSIILNAANGKQTSIIVDVENILTRTDADSIVYKLAKIAESENITLNFYSAKSGLINLFDMVDYKHLDNTKKLEKQIKDGKISTLFVYAESSLDEELLKQVENVIYVGTHHNNVSKLANIVLPSVQATEKNSLWNNVEGRVVEAKAVTTPMAESKTDWKIWRALSEFVGEPLKYNNLDDLRAEISNAKKSYSKDNLNSIVKNSNMFILETDKVINKKNIELYNYKIKEISEVVKNSVFYK